MCIKHLRHRYQSQTWLKKLPTWVTQCTWQNKPMYQTLIFFLSFFFLKVKSWFTDITSTLNYLPQFQTAFTYLQRKTSKKTLSLIDLQFSPTAFRANTSPLKTGRHPWTSPGNVILSRAGLGEGSSPTVFKALPLNHLNALRSVDSILIFCFYILYTNSYNRWHYTPRYTKERESILPIKLLNQAQYVSITIF